MNSFIEAFNEGHLAALRFLASALQDYPNSAFTEDISHSYIMAIIEARYEDIAKRPMWCTCNATHTCEGHRA